MRALKFLLALVAAAAAAQAKVTPVPADMSDAFAARAMLSPDTWARVVRLDNSHPRGAWRGQMYPRIVYGLVFEFSGALWFYADEDGTQSLSRTLGTLDRDKADPGPLFRDIEPGISSWQWVDDVPGPKGPASRRPPRVCFIDSLRALDQRRAVGGEADSPQLLLYYLNTRIGRLGHTVLLFRAGGALSVIDATQSDEVIRIPSYLGSDLRSIAEYLRNGPVSSVRALPISVPRKAHPRGWAAIGPRAGQEG